MSLCPDECPYLSTPGGAEREQRDGLERVGVRVKEQGEGGGEAMKEMRGEGKEVNERGKRN